MKKWQVEIPDPRYFEKLICCREGCPVNTDARGYVQAVSMGDYEQAYRIARGPNPFASICGLVCGAPCEAACRRGDIDEPVTIRAIKRTTTVRHGVEAAENLSRTLEMSTAPGSLTPEPRTERVAIIGAGVAGLTAAHDLARLGYKSTIFERDERPGGMIRTGVPLYRMPEHVWEKECDAIIENMDVEMRYGVRVGEDITIPEIKAEGFGAVIITTGLPFGRMLPLEGKENKGIYNAIEFIDAFNARREWPALGNVVVIGGGNVAYDAARSAIRMESAKSVTLVCLESQEEMPADDIEVEEGDEEGVRRLNRKGPHKFIGKDGVVTGLEVQQVESVFDKEGRFAPTFIEGKNEVLDADTIITAIGQVGDSLLTKGMDDFELGRGETVVAQKENGATTIPWLFAAGDVALGPGLFINCIGQAQKAVKSIHQMFVEARGETAESVEKEFCWIEEGIRTDLRSNWVRLQRELPQPEDVKKRLSGNDVLIEKVFEHEVAGEQGARCLRCEVETIFDGEKCIVCGGCADVCPTWCLQLVNCEDMDLPEYKDSGMSAIIKDEDRCIRCAMCAARCPTGAITMERLNGYEPWATPDHRFRGEKKDHK